jgi:prepilin-type N-terminal cleavage/methylation domain-containing protein
METNKHECLLIPARFRNTSFTLLELMVVIAIVVVLAGLLFPAVQSVLDRAKKVQAKNDLTQIVTAVNAFYTEYGKYPLPSGMSGDGYASGAITGTTSKDILDPLRNLDPTLNPRRIVFISPAEDTTQASPKGKIGSDGQFHDPWGTAYGLSIDADYDNQLPNPYAADTGAGPLKIRQGVIAWSVGKDAKLGNNGDNSFKNASGVQSDDVISWH